MTSARRTLACALLMCSAHLGVASALVAQETRVTGLVLADGTERAISDALITVTPLTRQTRSDSAGRFHVGSLPVGTYRLVVRAIGFDSLVTDLQVTSTDPLDVEILLTPVAQRLATVKTSATIVDLRLAEFEERRALGFGRFLDAREFERNPGSQVDVVIIGKIPGIRTTRKFGKMVLTASRNGKLCYPQIVVNGLSLFNGVMKRSGDPRTDAIALETMLFDINTLRTDEIVGFEWHNPASTPARYNATSGGDDGSSCGTAIIWTK